MFLKLICVATLTGGDISNVKMLIAFMLVMVLQNLCSYKAPIFT